MADRTAPQTETTLLPSTGPTIAAFGGRIYTLDSEACLIGYTGPAAPLITPWTLPTGCASMMFYSSCTLPNMQQFWYCESQMDYYSPAQCPLGYTAGGTTLSELPPLQPEETARFCCPSSHTRSRSGCVPTRSDDTMQGVPAIQIRWQSSDLSLFPPQPTPTITPGNSRSSSESSRPASAEASPRTSPGNNSGLGTGTKAGIGVGVALGSIIIISIIVFLLRCRKRRSVGQAVDPAVYTDEGADAPELVEWSVIGRKDAPALNVPHTPEVYQVDQNKALSHELTAGAYSPTSVRIPQSPSISYTQHELDSQNNNQPIPGPVLPYSHDSMQSRSQIEVVPGEGLEVVQPDPREQERARVREELAKIEARRERLREMHHLEYEEEQLRQRLSQLENRP